MQETKKQKPSLYLQQAKKIFALNNNFFVNKLTIAFSKMNC